MTVTVRSLIIVLIGLTAAVVIIVGMYNFGHVSGVASVPTATATPTATSSPTPTYTPTPTNTPTATSTFTPVATNTRVPTNTPVATNTRVPTQTPLPTVTPGADPEVEFWLGFDLMCRLANDVASEFTGGMYRITDCQWYKNEIRSRGWYENENMRSTATPGSEVTPGLSAPQQQQPPSTLGSDA